MVKPPTRQLDDSTKQELREFLMGLLWVALGVLAFIYLLWTEMRSYYGY